MAKVDGVRFLNSHFERALVLESPDESLDEITKLIYEIATSIFKALLERKKNWIVEQSKEYVETIKSTQVVTEIPQRHEVLLPEGDYVAIGSSNMITNSPGLAMRELFKYYRDKK